jgi:hypothetical protein
MLSDPDPRSFCALFEVLNHDDVLNEVAFFGVYSIVHHS